MFKLNTRFLTNPFYLYVFTNFFVLFLYELGGSNLLPKLSFELIVFYCISSLLMFVIGYLSIHSKLITSYKSIHETHNSSLVFFILVAGFFLEFINNGGIPLFMFGDLDYDYTKFGIKTFHPLLISFMSFYTVYLFHLYISTKNQKLLFKIVVLSLFPILIMSRGTFLLNCSSMFIVYLMSIRFIKLRNIFILMSILALLMYLFGMAGDLRTGGTDILVPIFDPSDGYISSNLPTELLWPYLYITSPLGNLQETINAGVAKNGGIGPFVIQSMLPDFVSKYFESNPNMLSRIAPFLTVGTVYGNAYVNMGWFGILFTFMFLTAVILSYLVFLPRNTPYSIPGLAIISTLVIFNIFDNMIVFSGLSFQLIYPLMLGLAYKYKLLPSCLIFKRELLFKK